MNLPVIAVVFLLVWPVHGSVADATPTPAAMAPFGMPAIHPVQWQGVTLGENIDAVRARLGTPEFNRKVILGSMLVEYPLHGGEGTLLLETTEHTVTSIRVEAASPKDLQLPIGDPFGVNLGDSLTRLLTVRGEPTRSDDDGPEDSNSIYGPASENRWVYSIHSGVVVGITLVAPKPPPPPPNVPFGHSGITLSGTPAPHRGTTIRGTPKPSPIAVAAPKSSPTPLPGVALSTPVPVPTTSPTPVPGLAVAPPTPAPGPGRSHPTPTPLPSASPNLTAMTPPISATEGPVGPSAAPSGATPAASATTLADGSSVQTAIVVRAPDQATGFDYMYKFIESIECGGSAHYNFVDQSIISQNRHNYAKIIAECPPTHERRAFYFDITYIFTRSER